MAGDIFELRGRLGNGWIPSISGNIGVARCNGLGKGITSSAVRKDSQQIAEPSTSASLTCVHGPGVQRNAQAEVAVSDVNGRRVFVCGTSALWPADC